MILVRIFVEDYKTELDPSLIREYTMDFEDPSQRRVLVEQTRYALHAGQAIQIIPERVL